MKKNMKYYTDEQKEVFKFIIIIVVLVLVIGGIYLITDKYIEKGSRNTTTGTVNYDKATIGTMLNRPYDEYYVIIYDSKSHEASYYSSLINKYKENEDALKVYFIDLNNELNRKYYNVNNDNISNKSAKSISELDLGDITLIKILNKEINDYIDDITNIEKILIKNVE